MRCKFIRIWRIDHHLDGGRKIIMNSGTGENAPFVGFFDYRKLGDGHPVG